MATATVTPLAPTLESQLALLAHKQVTVSYALVGVLVFVLALTGVGGWLGLKFEDAQLTRAAQLEQRFDADRKQFADILAANTAQRTQEAAQQATVVKIVDTRDKAADTAIQAAVVPGAPVQAIASGLQSAYSDVPNFGTVEPTPDGKIALEPPQAQQVTSFKLDRDRLFSDLGDTRNLFTIEQEKSTSLTADLTSCKNNLAESQQVIAKYKSAAKVSRLKKVLHGAESGFGIAAGFLVGFEMGRKL